jgi:hypothetical protein
MKSCRLCRQPSVRDLLDLGQQPASNRYRPSPDGPEYVHPLIVGVCRACGLVQLDNPMPPSEVRPRFDWITYSEPEGHLDDLAQQVRRLPGLTAESAVVGVSRYDDSTLRRLGERDLSRTRGLSLADDFGITVPGAGAESIQARLTPSTASEVAARHGRADLVVARYVLEHAHDTAAFLAGLRELVVPGGHIVFEVPDCMRALESCEYSTLWEEHPCYFTPATLRYCLARAGLEVVSLHSYPYPVDNALVAIARVPVQSQPAPLPDDVETEVARGSRFLREFLICKARQQAFFTEQSRRGKIAFLGAGHLSCAYLNLFELASLVDLVIDDHPKKKGMFMPGSRLPILGREALLAHGVRLCLMSVRPEIEDAVIDKNRAFLAVGGVLASLFPGSPYALRLAA